MKENVLVNGGALESSLEATLAVEQFLNENYLFRRNILNGKVEFVIKPSKEDAEASGGEVPVWETFTPRSLNSLVRRAKKDQVLKKGSPKTEIKEFIESDDIPVFNPIGEFLASLPKWDGQNHIAKLFSRIPGVTTEQLGFLTTWFLSAVAHWLQKDTLHGNECVPTFIGDQGCGKTTFFKRLLPPELRQYFLDHLNLSNKFDKEMALTTNLLVCLDELEAIRPCQQAALKQTLSKSRVNGRPIYGASQEDRPRFASFVATTNNQQPLQDETGSRRYICISIPSGEFIDNDGEIDYQQLYAQAVYELNEAKTPYWFNNDEVARIQALNHVFMAQRDMKEMVELTFRKPEKGEKAESMNSTMMLQLIQKKFTSLKIDHSAKIRLGLVMSDLHYDSKAHSNVSFYQVVPLKSA